MTWAEDVTIGELYDPAMKITGQAEADAYFERLVEHNMRFDEDGEPKTRERAEAIERSNLGYYAGYCGGDTRARVERLFRCAHPIFGSIAERGRPSSEEAFEIGQRIGELQRDVREA
jgi:hypothetical protein